MRFFFMVLPFSAKIAKNGVFSWNPGVASFPPGASGVEPGRTDPTETRVLFVCRMYGYLEIAKEDYGWVRPREQGSTQQATVSVNVCTQKRAFERPTYKLYVRRVISAGFRAFCIGFLPSCCVGLSPPSQSGAQEV